MEFMSIIFHKGMHNNYLEIECNNSILILSKISISSMNELDILT